MALGGLEGNLLPKRWEVVRRASKETDLTDLPVFLCLDLDPVSEAPRPVPGGGADDEPVL